MPDFLLEIGCEEIPARMIDAASAELRERLSRVLGREHLSPSGEVISFDTPRRLAVLASGIPAAQSDVTERITGPSVKVAYKDGQPTPAAHAFAKRVGAAIGDLARITTSKGDYLAATITRKGRPADEILAEALPNEISALYWPKTMYWLRDGASFVRPVRWLVAMLDDQVVPVEVLDFGVSAGRASRGHRILHDGVVEIPRAGSAYVDSLRAAKVLGRAEREQRIRKALDAGTRTIPGARWREDKALLDTVVNLTEFPSVILGGFDPQFLALPEEVLVTVMRDHQKYFALENAEGKLLPHFLAVLNTDSDPQGLIRHGNERVLRARFNDARFFWQTDQKISLLERLELLRHVTFQKELGSYYDKTQRVQRLSSWLSEILRGNSIPVRPGVIHKAACLAKTDLTTEMVKEFTELQGVVGGLYARVQQLDQSLPEATRMAIADAIYDQYKPESTDDDIPRSIEGAVLSIADKADTIAGMFALGLVPSGSKDPFALRRQANGIVKIIAEKKLPLDLFELFVDARKMYRGSAAEKKFTSSPEQQDLPMTLFLRERLQFYLRDVRGYAYDVVNAVLASDQSDILDEIARAEAITKVRAEEKDNFDSVCVSFKRIKNILQQAAEKNIPIPDNVDESLNGPTGSAQDDLWRRGAVNTWAEFEVSRKSRSYVSALLGFASLKSILERFFDEVMVMVDEAGVRGNRLAILRKLYERFSTIADFSEIVAEGKA